MKKILINGFGRIGRCVFRNVWERGDAECIFINEPGMTVGNIMYLMKFDSIYGRFPGDIEQCGEKRIRVSDCNKKWEVGIGNSKELYTEGGIWDGIRIVVDATGNDMCAARAWDYIEKGVEHVVVTNTFYGADFTYVMGHNEKELCAEKHKVISTSICDANAVIPLFSKLISEIGVDFCFVTTLHPWLSYQNLMDAPVRMQRKSGESYSYFPLGRASVNTLIPKSTTLGPVLEFMFPILKNKLSYFSYRTPTQMVASAEMSFVLSRAVKKEEMIELLERCDRNVVNLNREDIISIDCEKQPYSSIVDMRWLDIQGKYLKLVTWYDNEWGYCSRVTDLINIL
ncbi:MAG: hypothetical protein HFG25_02785 [Lachnospiraceae bacterium]|nr:hypothetical protein [Lachnospiraceae bacterium]